MSDRSYIPAKPGGAVKGEVSTAADAIFEDEYENVFFSLPIGEPRVPWV